MCGIFGLYRSNEQAVQKENLLKMGKALLHRGPDDQGVYVHKHVGLGNQRLSIIDIKGGHQPFVSETGEVALVQNGEIYNHVELRQELQARGRVSSTHSDTEVLLQLYQEEGLSFLNQLNGMFAIAIYDQRVDRLYLVRDRMGVKPLYYYEGRNQLAFASEIKAIFAAGVPAEFDPSQLSMYLQLGYLPPPYTLFKNIKQLEPGQVLEMGPEGLNLRQWWSLPNEPQTDVKEENIIEELQSLFKDSVRLRTRADVPCGAFLSGGVDSSWVVGNLVQVVSDPVKTFTVSFRGTKFDEAAYAQEVADRFHTHHHAIGFDRHNLRDWVKSIYHCDLPTADISFLPTGKLSELAASEVKLVLSGDGADEIFAGYQRYTQIHSDQNLGENWIKAYHVLSPAQIEELQFTGPGWSGGDWYESRLQAWSQQDPINRILALECQTLLPGNNLMKPDRMGMAASLEARTPYMDYRLVELAMRIPGPLKLKGGITKYLLKEAALNVCEREFLQRPKQMFTVPVTEWQGLAELGQKLLLKQDRGLFSRKTQETWLRAHRKNKQSYLRELRALISLEIWFRLFVDGEAVENLEDELFRDEKEPMLETKT